MGLYTQCRAQAAAIANTLDKNKTPIAVLLIAAYAAINGILLYFHEPWGDEAQVWLIARDLDFWKIPSLMKYEGHPCMWHWIIYPFVRAGLPYITLNIVSYVIMLAATAFVVWKAPFPIWVKALFALSPCLTYFYPVIARSYCLIPPILFALAYFHPSRLTHPCRYTLFIALLVQTHVIMEMMALMLSLLLLIEYARDVYATRNCRKAAHYFAALLIPLASALFLLYLLRDVESASAYHGIKHVGIGDVIGFLSSRKWFVLAVVVLAVMAIIKKSKSAYVAVVVTVVNLCFQMWFFIAVYPIAAQRTITALLIIMWAFWIIQDERNGSITKGLLSLKYAKWIPRLCNIFLFLFLAVMTKIFMPVAKQNIKEPHSNSKDAAKFINANISKDAILLTDATFWASAITPYIEQPKMVYCSTMTEYSFVTYDENWEVKIDYEDFKRRISTYDNSKVPVYLISTGRWSDVVDNRFSEDYELVYKSAVRSIKGEDYEIYKIH